jgi:citrate lyase beta subunit
MPTLETAEVFIERDMLALRDILLQEPWRSAVASLRIGGNDLLGLLGMRREAGYTLYDSVLGTHIDRLVGIFKPHGFELSAPVFEFLNDADNLRREVKQDLLHGLTGKTAIHPDQIPLIESMYQVSEQDLLMAQTLMASDKAVFQYEQRMQEYSTHYKWANKILKTVESL